jgi:hypothetical protein
LSAHFVVPKMFCIGLMMAELRQNMLPKVN